MVSLKRKLKAKYNRNIGRHIKALATRIREIKKRYKNFKQRLLHPIYLFPIKLLTFTLYYLIRATLKLIIELITAIIDTILFPFKSLRNFFKSLLIIMLIIYIAASSFVMVDYIYEEYGHYSKFLCSAQSVRQMMKGSVVRVVGGYSEGSGFFIDKNTVLTNFHVITGEPSPKIIFPDGSFTIVTGIVGDPLVDLALLRSQEQHQEMVLDMSSYRDLLENEPLIAVGYPGGTKVVGEATMLEGNYLTVRTSKNDPAVFIHTNINLAGGMSGGPLIDKCGTVVGINTAGISGNSFFISTDTFWQSKDSFSDQYVTKINLDPSKSPEEAVKALYTYLKVRDMEAGFNLLSQEYLKNTNFDEWTSRFSDVIDVTVIKTEPRDWPPNTAFIKFGTKNWVDGEVYVHYYEGTWQTVFEDGLYKMLEANIVEVDYPEFSWFWTSD